MEQIKKQRYEKRFFLSLFIIVLVLFAAVSIYNNQKSLSVKAEEPVQSAAVDYSENKPDKLSLVSGIVYRHLVAYNLVCTEAKMPLKNYPEYFSKTFAPEIQTINIAWERRGKSLESVLTDYDSLIYPSTQENIQEELLNIERDFVKAVKAKEAGVTPDQITWGEQQEKALNLTDACMLFDEAAEGIVEKSGFETMFRDLMKGI